MRETIFVTINFPVGKITQPLTRWANDYDIPVALIYKRYYLGLNGYDLIAPTPSDIIDYNDIRRIWHGKWRYNPAIKRKTKKYKENLRWVYVGT